jgi:hypothetical protein
VSSIFNFGEQIAAYDIPVLNERAVRAAAGILFLGAIIAFMNAWLLGNFQPTRVFVIVFLLDFSIRIFINPRYAPSLIAGQWIVRKQQPEYVGAAQKRFAWGIGLVLALTMWYLVVLNHVIGPINLIVCVACLSLLFFEAAFGICIGCKVYNLFYKDKARLCPGNTCASAATKKNKITVAEIIWLLVFALVTGTAAKWIYSTDITKLQPAVASTPSTAVDAAEAERCTVPDFAKAMGHEEKWKLHNNCK